jgi:glutathione S-transferase
MELIYADLSPYSRKVRVVIDEKGLTGSINMTTVNPYEVPQNLAAVNPLSRIPTLVLDNGLALFDSTVICEYLDATNQGNRLLPAEGEARFEILSRNSIANGTIDAAFNVSCEINRRDEGERSPKWIKHWTAAIQRSVDAMNAQMDDGRWQTDAIDMAAVTAGCALAYLDVRCKDLLDWRAGNDLLATWHKDFAMRPSMLASAPKL